MKKPSGKGCSTEAATHHQRRKIIRELGEKMKGMGGRRSSHGEEEEEEEVKKGPWTAEEDEILMEHIKKQGEGSWRTLPKRAGLLRCGKSCRLRWMNYLRPNVKRGHISPDEEDLILRLHRLLGNRWSLIAGRIPGRTDNEIKNYWNTHLSKKLIRQGVDPRTHKPFSDPHLIPQNLIKPNHVHDKGANHDDDDDDVTPNNANPNSSATATASQSSTSNRRAHHPGVSSTNESSPTKEHNDNQDDNDNKNLSRDDGKVAEEEYQQHISTTTKILIQNIHTINTGSATYDADTTIATTTTPAQSTTGLDLCCDMLSQGRVHPNYSANTSTNVQLLNQHFNDGYNENMLVDKGDDDLFSSFLNSLINDEMIFPCNNVDEGSQLRQDFGVLPADPPAHQGGGGDSAHAAVTMNIISAATSLGFQMIDRWDGPYQ